MDCQAPAPWSLLGRCFRCLPRVHRDDAEAPLREEATGSSATAELLRRRADTVDRSVQYYGRIFCNCAQRNWLHFTLPRYVVVTSEPGVLYDMMDNPLRKPRCFIQDAKMGE